MSLLVFSVYLKASQWVYATPFNPLISHHHVSSRFSYDPKNMDEEATCDHASCSRCYLFWWFVCGVVIFLYRNWAGLFSWLLNSLFQISTQMRSDCQIRVSSSSIFPASWSFSHGTHFHGARKVFRIESFSRTSWKSLRQSPLFESFEWNALIQLFYCSLIFDTVQPVSSCVLASSERSHRKWFLFENISEIYIILWINYQNIAQTTLICACRLMWL